MVNEGRVALRLRRDAFAADVLSEALDRYAEAPSPQHYEVTARMLLGSARRRLGDTIGAREILDDAWVGLAAAEHGHATQLQRAKVAMELAQVAAVDDTADERDAWVEDAVAAGEATGSGRFAASIAAGAVDLLLQAGDCPAAEDLTTRHPLPEAEEPRWTIARARIDVCRGDPDAAIARLHEVLIVADPDDPAQQRTIGGARFALHEASVARGDLAGARDNLRVVLATLDATALDEARWTALFVAAARVGVTSDADD
jgi:hypothetical protein